MMLRGINRQDIFENDEDYQQMISILRGLTDRYDEQGLQLPPLCFFYAYCLMSNHVHLLIQEREEHISDIVKRIGVTFAHYFNKKYERNGHLFQDRFRSEPVDSIEYFVILLRYIHQNPLKAGIEWVRGRFSDLLFSLILWVIPLLTPMSLFNRLTPKP